MRTRYDIITTIIVILLFAFILFMKKENIKEYKIAHQQGIKDGKQDQIEENIEKGVMTDDGKWLNEFKLAGEK